MVPFNMELPDTNEPIDSVLSTVEGISDELGSKDPLNENAESKVLYDKAA
jgi:hypothetical protein